ncbi:TIGD4 [Cordylochernes scorpioides]|uniref:TIGD4 n=1 Tax=Cordylochernes scorpioides TaxID=51811 RepID=A0ABY6JYF9_9ARAC|nr:TIGD4 [Cordylochernes scorpioides]
MSKRKSLSIVEKVALLKEVESGIRKKDIALKYGIPPSTVSTIIKSREFIIKAFEDYAPDRKRFKTGHFENVDEAVLQWIKIVRDKNIPISGPLIKKKALEFANRLGETEFKASSGWLEKFRKRHGLKEKVFPVESRRMNNEITDEDNWVSSVLKRILESYHPDDIFNVDQTGLFYRYLPNNENHFSGSENYRERITVLIGANMSGIKSLEVDYRYDKKALITPDIFEEWLLNLDEKMNSQKRKIALFVDNFPGHSNISSKLLNIKLIFFPPNTNSKWQPMDQGVITNLKLYYKKCILKRLIWVLDNEQNIDKVIDLRICIGILSKVWENDISESTVKYCFAKAGFIDFSNKSIEEEDIDILSQVEQCWENLQTKGFIEGISLDQFLDIDEGVIISEYPIIEDSEQNDKEDTEENETVEPNKPSKKEMITAFETIRRGFQFYEGIPENIFHALNKCEHFHDEISSKVMLQQDILLDFLLQKYNDI